MSTLIRKRPAPLWALLLPLACFAAAPLVRGPIFSSSDGILHLYQLIEFDAVLRAGVPFPRWAPDLLSGYGYPQMIFYAPLMYYLASAFHFVGLGYVDALKATVLAGMVASEAGMFVLGRELWGRWGGLLAAVAYLYFPYRLVNTYLDGELSQTLAWAWLPGLVWACWRFLRSGGRGHWLLAAACWAGLIYTHSVTSWLTAMFLGLLLLAWLALREARLLDELYLVGALALGTGLAAPYWLPALAEAGFVQLGRVQTGSYDFHVNLLPLGRVLSTELAHGYSGYVGANGPAQLGLLQLLAGATGLVAGIAACRGKAARLAAPFAALSLVAIVLMLEPAAPFWEHVPFGSALQFPDRLLGMLGFLLAVLAGAAGLWLRRLPTIPAALLAVAACAALIYAATARLNPAFVALPSSLSVADAAESDQSTGAIATTAKGEYTPIWMPAPLATSPLLPGYLTGRTPSIAAPGGAEITLLQHAPSDVGLAVSAPSAGIVELPVTYYPGWTASRSGATVPVEPSKRGLIAVDLPAGQSDLQLHFGSTSDRRLATAVGLLAVIAILSIFVTVSIERRVAWGILLSRRTLRSTLRVTGGAAILALALFLMPGKLQLASWPAARPELVNYAGWLQLLGADVEQSGEHVRVSALFRTGVAQSAKPLQASVRLITRETVWASASQPLPADGWTSAVPRRFDFDLPLPAGTPAGVYQLELQLRTPDGAVVGPDSSPLTYDTPRVGPVQLGPLTIADPVPGTTAGQPPAGGDFGPLRLVAWQPPVDAEQGQFVPMNLWWQASAVPGGDWDVSLHVVDASGQTWAGHDDQPRMAYNPTSLWAAGQLERDVQMLLLPAGMPPGSYTVLAGWYDASSHAPIGSQNVPLGQIAVKPSSRPDPSSLDIPHALRQEFAQGLTLLGYELPNPRVIAGQPVPLRLFWQTARQPAGDLGLTVHFDGRGATLPLPATSQWQPGQLMETRLSLPTAPDWAGSGRLGLSLDGGPPQIELPQSITVEAPNRLTSLPSGPSKASPATLAGAVALAGYREDAGGGELRLTLYWQPLMPLPADLHVFTHLLDGQSHVVSQHDGVPASGQRPTSTWTAGEYVEDVHELTLPSTGGPFQIEVGLYDPATGRRLGDRLLLGPPP